MNVTATAKFIRMSPIRARDIAREVTGLPVDQALRATGLSERKAAFLIAKTLKSAVANAENNAKLDVGSLRVKGVFVDEGPRLRRYWSRARGSVRPIRRKLCHIKVVLTDDQD